jgi:hypothetical protein
MSGYVDYANKVNSIHDKDDNDGSLNANISSSNISSVNEGGPQQVAPSNAPTVPAIMSNYYDSHELLCRYYGSRIMFQNFHRSKLGKYIPLEFLPSTEPVANIKKHTCSAAAPSNK